MAPRILGAFSVVLALMLVVCGIGVWGMAKIRGEAQFVQTDVLPAVKGLGEVDANFREGRAHQLAVLTSRTPAERTANE